MRAVFRIPTGALAGESLLIGPFPHVLATT
jgi:hypothetical protein